MCITRSNSPEVLFASILTTVPIGTRYDLWRVYEIDNDGAKMRIARDIGAFAKGILDSLKLPLGVTVDSVSIDPAVLSWGGELLIERADEDPDGE